MKFSIIIPSFNEGEDIRLSIESAISQTYLDREILVVDDSSDNTPEIIQEYRARGVRLINGFRKGCCEARNLGIREASGQVVVMLNADVRLPPDFLERIKKHYDNGVDYVLVESRVFNDQNLWARFVEMQHRLNADEIGNRASWTEGFSARRAALLNVGLIPGDFPLKFCRDWILGERLREAGFKKVVDKTIIVLHKSPDNFRDYWRVRKARGRFGSLMQHFLYQKPLPFLAVKFAAKDLLFLLKFLLILPAIIRVAKIASYSAKPFRDFFPFYLAYFLQELARVLGEWEGLLLVMKAQEH